MKNFPKLVIDSKKITELRMKTQKEWEMESFWPWIFLRRFSIYISFFISKFTNITPNQITIFGILVGFISSIILINPSRNIQIIGFIMYQLVYLVDCVDGEVARIKNETSAIGHWLDSGLRYSLYAMFFSIMTTNIKTIFPNYVDYISLLLVIFILSSIWATDNERVSSLSKEYNKKLKKKNLILDFVIFLLATDPGFYLVYLIALLSDSQKFISFVILYHLLVFFIKTMHRLIIIKNNSKGVQK